MSSQKENVPISCGGANVSLADIEKSGYLRKLKTMRKKFFVLRSESGSGPARLEYYDNEKKFRLGGEAKRTVLLSSCFNINKKSDAKHKHAIALYTKDDCFSLVAEDEESQLEWLRALLEQQRAGGDGKPIPAFEHVWQVTVKPKGLGSSKSLSGSYRLCLTTTTISLVRMNCENEALEFSLSSIRRCGHSDCFFFMEVGRQAVTGPGELWMQVEDTVIAQSIHEASLEAMRSVRQQEEMRPRSHSSTINSGGGTDPKGVSGSGGRRQANTLGPSWRTRCDSMPVPNRQGPGRSNSRVRVSSEGEEGQPREEHVIASSSSPVSNLTNSFMRPRTCSEGGGGMGHSTVPRGRSSLLKFGNKLRPRTSSEGEKGLKAPDSPTKTRGRFSVPALSPRSSMGGGPIRPLSVHRMAAPPMSNSPPIPNSPLSESPQGYVDERYTPDAHLPEDHYYSRFGTSGRSRTPDSPSHISIREESHHEANEEYMSMSPSASSKALPVPRAYGHTLHPPSHQYTPHRLSPTILRRPTHSTAAALSWRRASSPAISPVVSPTMAGSTPFFQQGGAIPREFPLYQNHTPHAAPLPCVSSSESSPRSLSPLVADEPDSYMAMTPSNRSRPGSASLVSSSPATLVTPSSSHRLASGALKPPAANEDEGYMMMGPSPGSKRATPITIAPQAGSTNEEPSTYMLMNPSTNRSSSSSSRNNSSLAWAPAPPAVSPLGSGGSFPAQRTLPRGSVSNNKRNSAGEDMSNHLTVSSSLHQRSHSEPVVDTYSNIEFQPRGKRGSQDSSDNNNTVKSPSQRYSLPAQEPRYINVAYTESQDEVDSTVQVTVNAPESRHRTSIPENVNTMKEGLAVVENGSVENALNGEYVNMNFGGRGSKSSTKVETDLSLRQVPPLILDDKPHPLPDSHDYINVDVGGRKEGVKTSPRHTPNSPPSPSWLRRPVAEQLLQKSLEDLSLGNRINIPSRGSANSLTGLGRGNDGINLGGLPSSHHSSRRSSQSSLVGEKELNYIDVDIGQPVADISGSSTPTLREKRSRSPFRRSPNEEKQLEQVNYSTIDFTKSEGLRSVTTNLRDSRF
ncbi:uncharacterized protein [Diadema antillarum]|uniref:uncharacterized protein n=1 Tax=Diadema antillarum TaxID=105358 RepID=UPI003A8753CF